MKEKIDAHQQELDERHRTQAHSVCAGIKV